MISQKEVIVLIKKLVLKLQYLDQIYAILVMHILS